MTYRSRTGRKGPYAHYYVQVSPEETFVGKSIGLLRVLSIARSCDFGCWTLLTLTTRHWVKSMAVDEGLCLVVALAQDCAVNAHADITIRRVRMLDCVQHSRIVLHVGWSHEDGSGGFAPSRVI